MHLLSVSLSLSPCLSVSRSSSALFLACLFLVPSSARSDGSGLVEGSVEIRRVPRLVERFGKRLLDVASVPTRGEPKFERRVKKELFSRLNIPRETGATSGGDDGRSGRGRRAGNAPDSRADLNSCAESARLFRVPGLLIFIFRGLCRVHYPNSAVISRAHGRDRERGNR